jgi:hypothetical protein
MAGERDEELIDEPDSGCGVSYDHREEITYEGADGVGWICRECGAEGWEPAEDEPS